jgi:hypothetical protein
MVAGWYLGRLLGLIRYPGEFQASAVSVYDQVEGEWVSFPDPLLTPIDFLTHAGDRLAAVLESMPIALAACHGSARLEPLRPYRLLRQIWDDSRYEPQHLRGAIAADRLIGLWVRQAKTASGAPGNPKLIGLDTHTPQERQAVLLESCRQLRKHVEPYLAPGQLGTSGIGEFSVLRSGRQLAAVPFFHEIAPDAYSMLGELADVIKRVSLLDQPDPNALADPHQDF